MTRLLARLTSTLALLAGLAAGADAAPFTFTFSLDPASGAIAGAPGRTVGWGFALRNHDPMNWLEVHAIDADPFTFGDPEPLSFPIVGPGATVAETFVRDARGLFQVRIDRDAPTGLLDSGIFHILVRWYDGDPLDGGTLVLAPDDAMVAARASYAVSARAAVPEPSTLLLVGVGAAAALERGRRRRSPATLPGDVQAPLAR